MKFTVCFYQAFLYISDIRIEITNSCDLYRNEIYIKKTVMMMMMMMMMIDTEYERMKEQI